MAHLYKINPPVSMLVVKVESEYFKKATGLTIFVCEDGEQIQRAIEESIATGDARIVRAKSVGRNKNDEVIAEFRGHSRTIAGAWLPESGATVK